MPPFETLNSANAEMLENPSSFIFNPHFAKVDTTGQRVLKHSQCMLHQHDLSQVAKYLTGHNSKLKMYKFWVHIPLKCKIDYRKKIVRIMHSLKTSFLRNVKSFQRTIVNNWNSSVKKQPN